MKVTAVRYMKLSAIKIKRNALYASVACIVLVMATDKASSSEPFQILESDLGASAPVRSSEPQPFLMLSSDTADVASAGRTIIYQNSESAGDAEITNNTDESLYFNDQSTAAAASIINNTGGATHFNNEATAASAFITNNSDASLTFNQNSTAADARITNNQGGNLVFNDTASAASAVIANNGAAIFNGNSSADNALITNNQSGTIGFNDQSDAGRRNIYNNGQITFADQSSAQNSLIDNNQTGSIQFTGNSTGAAANINNSGQISFSGDSSAGATAIVNNDTGTLSFSEQANAADTTITNNGSVRFSDTSNASAARLINNAEATLLFQNQASAGSSMIVNAGDLNFSGSSTADQATILTSQGGTIRFQDQADGGSATLQLDQNARLDISQLTENRLSLGALTSAGDINLGRSVLNVQGSAVLNDTSTLNLVLGYGKIIAQDVELQGGKLELQRAADLLYALGETYYIIEAQSFSGSNFSPDISHDFAFVTPQLSDNGIGVTLERNDVNFASVAQTQNQTAVANALEGMAADTLVYRAIISSSEDDARRNFDQLSGEIHASIESAVHDNSSLLRLALVERARRAANTYPSGENPWQSWLKVSGTVNERNGNGNAASGRFSGYGVTGGVDRAFGEMFTLGIAGNYEQNTFKIADRASTADIKTFGAGIYSGLQYQGFGLRSGASYQRHAIDIDRTITLPSVSASLQSDYSAWTGQVFAEAGYSFNAGGIGIEPFAGISYTRSHFGSFQETGLNDAALSGASASLNNTTGMFGIRMNKHFMLNNALSVDAQFEAAWNRAFGNQRVIRHVAFATGLPFEITGTDVSKDYLQLDARLAFMRTERFGLDLFYSGLISSAMNSHSFGTTAKIRF